MNITTSFDNDDDTDSLCGTLVEKDDEPSDASSVASSNSDSEDDFQSVSGGESTDGGNGSKMFLQKRGKCFALQKCGNGISFTPIPKLAGIRGDGLYLRVDSGIYITETV